MKTKKKKPKIGYKAVRQTYIQDGGVSYQIRSVLEYRIGITTKREAKCGPLAVFNTLEDAAAFNSGQELLIFKCKYIPSGNRSLWFPGAGVRRTDLPSGTRFANSVTLLERVK